MTRDPIAEVDRAGSSDEAWRTAAPPGAVTRSAVTTRVVGAAVRCGAGTTDVCRRARAAVTGDQVRADAAIATWSWRTFIHVVLTVTSCVRTSSDDYMN